MKLFNLDHSPFSTRVRMQVYRKQLEIAVEPPPLALGSAEFMQAYPLAKIPVLELDDGDYLGDSWVIMEYLEDISPALPLRPAGVVERAQMLMLARCADTCLGPSGLFPLFASVTSAGDADKDTGPMLQALDAELARLERLLQQLPDCEQRALHLGDIALVPHMDYVLLLAPMFGIEQPLEAHPRVAAWHQWALRDNAVARASEEMHVAVRAFFGS